MTVRQLPKAEWQGYFDRVSKGLEGKQADIEVAALPLGDQIAAKWVPLIGITYDPKDDILEVALENLDHLIRGPSSISVDDNEIGLSTLEVTDAEGRRQIVQLKDPLMLPAPAR